MADARLPVQWRNEKRFACLSLSERWTLVTMLMFSVANRTDGHVDHGDLALESGANPKDVKALVAGGFWAKVPGGWQIVEYDATQTSRHGFEMIDKNRLHEKDRKAKQRAATLAKKRESERTPTSVPPDVRPDVCGDKGGDKPRQGQARQRLRQGGLEG